MPAITNTDPLRAIAREFESQIAGLPRCSAVNASIAEFPDRVVIQLDVPGMTEDQLDVSVEDGCLIVSGDRSNAPADNGRLLFSNRSNSSFRRVIRLDRSLDPNRIEASLTDGVLTLEVGRREEFGPRKVSVRSTAQSENAV